MKPTYVDALTIGDAWLKIARRITNDGRPGLYEGRAVRELLQTTVRVEHPSSHDETIERLADPERLAWMHANFTDHSRVAALGDADSYATRLYDYARSGRDQVMWVIGRLRTDATCRSATITTFQPVTDTSYIPCVSLLDFYIDEGVLCQVTTCHSIDFGTKGYGNLVELADLSERVATALHVPVGPLTMLVKSAHIYDDDREYVHQLG